MQCKVGDTVRFLNETGGGVVSRIINAKMISVRDEDGFDIPVLMSDIVVINSAEEKKITKVSPKEELKSTVLAQSDSKAEQPSLINEEGNDFEALLAFVPVNEKDITNCDLELFLINDSTYNMLYTVGKWTVKNRIQLLAKNDLEPDSKEFIATLARADFNKLQSFNISFLLYKQTREFEIQVPEQVTIELNPLKFVKQGSFETNDFFDEKAVVYRLATNKSEMRLMDIDPKELARAMKDKKDQPQTISIKGKQQDVEEIDLHIECLVDNPKGMENAEILEIQKSRFITALDLGITANTRRMIFIHGIGNGKLKYEIRRLLDTQYAGKVRYQDASFKEYGYGATMVIV